MVLSYHVWFLKKDLIRILTSYTSIIFTYLHISHVKHPSWWELLKFIMYCYLMDGMGTIMPHLLFLYVHLKWINTSIVTLISYRFLKGLTERNQKKNIQSKSDTKIEFIHIPQNDAKTPFGQFDPFYLENGKR